MTLADATCGVEGTLAQSYHAVGYAMTGKMDRAIRVLESVHAVDGANISQEAVRAKISPPPKKKKINKNNRHYTK